jgi:predicted aminopeptidase
VTRALLLASLLLVSGCDTLSYYSQAIGGQLEILHAARPVDQWLADPATPAELKSRLELAQRIRRFAAAELALPDNRSYTSYAELGRPYVVWNVFAAPELTAEPKKECFPFTGCVGYRGFFSEEDARRHAQALKAQGYDVYVGGVPAYSTLGWFSDPLLSTYIRYPDAQLARLLFHELAHQVVYARDDTAFNESFAVTVEEEGVKRWLQAQGGTAGRSAELEAFQASQARRQKFAADVKATRTRLEAAYQDPSLSRDEKLERKRAEYAKLRALYPAIPAEPNNGFLVSVALYTELVPQFEALLRESGSLPAFYARVKELAKSGEYRRAL